MALVDCRDRRFYRQSTGGDSFTSFQWDAAPGEEPDYSNYLDQLHIVDDARPFHLDVEALDLSEPGFALEHEYHENPMIEEMDSLIRIDESANSRSPDDNAESETQQAMVELD